LLEIRWRPAFFTPAEAANAARGKCVTPEACLRHDEAKRSAGV
jgi:hypothetical protein